MQRTAIVVRAVWDDEAKVFVATSDDVPGLITEADTVEALRDKLLVIIPELIELNRLPFDLPEIPLHIMADRLTRVANPLAHV
jgi:predicted RNase H-like HicB family nuclease